MAIASSISILAFIIWGAVNGDWTDFIDRWHTSQFVRVMSIDFCVLSCLLPLAILKDDMRRRGIEDDKFFWLAVLFPLFGSLIYWCVRPQLESDQLATQLIADR